MDSRNIDLRLGSWQETLAGETCDALICDPPYSAMTHEKSADVTRNDRAARSPNPVKFGLSPDYAPLSTTGVFEFVESWAPRCRGWMVCLTDSRLIETYKLAYAAVDRYAFAPVPCVISGMSIRLTGDGPSSWAVYAMVSRPKSKKFATWGTLPGAYIGRRANGAGTGRGKPPWLMRALVRDYSRRGEVVIDPFVGWGSTLAAAHGLDRIAIGAELDPAAHTEAKRRLARGHQTDLFATG